MYRRLPPDVMPEAKEPAFLFSAPALSLPSNDSRETNVTDYCSGFYCANYVALRYQNNATVSTSSLVRCNSLVLQATAMITVARLLPRDEMQARSILSRSVCCLSVRPSVCHVRGSRQNK